MIYIIEFEIKRLSESDIKRQQQHLKKMRLMIVGQRKTIGKN